MQKLTVMYFFLFTPCFISFTKTIYIIPPHGYHNEKLFDLDDKKYNRDNSQLVFVRLREVLAKQGHVFSTLKKFKDKADFVVVCNLDNQKKKDFKELLTLAKKKKTMLFWFEPPTIQPWLHDKKLHTHFWKIFTTEDDWVDNKKYFKFYYPQPDLKILDELPSFEEKKLVTMIARCAKDNAYPLELYSERLRTIDFFEPYPYDFDFYGRGNWRERGYKTYKGPIDKKVDVLKNYRFCICYENTRGIRGYITEKIFDCLIAGCVPIYWGAPNIEEYIPKNCFIRREDFATNEQLYAYLKNITREEYQQYIDAIKKFLMSEKVHLFSIEYFIELFLKHMPHN